MARAPEQDEPQELVFALCHEIGNLVTAVQLEADLLDEVDSEVGLAASSVKIEDLCAQVGDLLSQVRPLLTEERDPQDEVSAEDIVGAVGLRQEWQGSGQAEFRIEVDPQLPGLRADLRSLRNLLANLVAAALEPLRESKRVSLRAIAARGGVAFQVCDDGIAEKALDDWRNAVRCGRPLVCAVAASLLDRSGGSVEARREKDQTCIEFWLPPSQG